METTKNPASVHIVNETDAAEMLKQIMRGRIEKAVGQIREFSTVLENSKDSEHIHAVQIRRDQEISELNQTFDQEKSSIEPRIKELEAMIANLRGNLAEFGKMRDEEIVTINKKYDAILAEHRPHVVLSDAQQADLRSQLSRAVTMLNLAEHTLAIEDPGYVPVGRIFDEELLKDVSLPVKPAAETTVAVVTKSVATSAPTTGTTKLTLPEAIEKVYHDSRRNKWLGLEDLLDQVRATGVSVTLKTYNQTLKRMVEDGRLVHDKDRKAYTLAAAAKAHSKT